MKKVKVSRFFTVVIIVLLVISFNSCMRYLTHDRDEVILEGIDIDQTLKVADVKMEERHGRWGTSLPIWVIRDQNITAAQAEDISLLYFNSINTLERKFDIWHLTWAISNIYRHGNDSVKAALSDAYSDAAGRAKELEGIADKMVNGEKLYMGDAHGGGRAFAKKHVVVPGKKGYLQTFEEFGKK